MSENVYENVKKELTPERIKATLNHMVSLMTDATGENGKKLQKAKEEANNDLIQLVKIAFPIILDIQMESLPLVGLPSTKEGLKDFLTSTNQLIGDDEEIYSLMMHIKSIYMPSVL